MTPPRDPTSATKTQDPIPQHPSPEEKQEIQDHAEELQPTWEPEEQQEIQDHAKGLNPTWEQEGQTESIEFGAESLSLFNSTLQMPTITML